MSACRIFHRTIVCIGLALVWCGAHGTGAGESPVAAFSIDAAKPVARISNHIYGLHVARWDECLFPRAADDMLISSDRDAIRKIKDAGFTFLKYHGGNDAEEYI